MLSPELSILALNAAAVGLIHALIGPDHYLPFVVMARARNWSFGKTAAITAVCGIGHVASSVVLGIAGLAVGAALQRLEVIESTRGSIAAWALIAFGAIYCAWGIRRAWRRTHLHPPGEGGQRGAASHDHSHHGPITARDVMTLTPWVLFTVFVFGPCEPLIPLFIYPAAMESTAGVWLVTLVFAVATIATMLVVVSAMLYGIRLVPLRGMERFSHALAGATIVVSGCAIQFLGL